MIFSFLERNELFFGEIGIVFSRYFVKLITSSEEEARRKRQGFDVGKESPRERAAEMSPVLFFEQSFLTKKDSMKKIVYIADPKIE